MDIKERIDALTEQEAKAALEEMIGTLALMRHTFSDDNMTLEDQENHYLDMALFMQREARE